MGFLGILDREALVEYLQKIGYELQKCGGYVRRKIEGTILDNTSTVQNHVCTYIEETDYATTRRRLQQDCLQLRGCKKNRILFWPIYQNTWIAPLSISEKLPTI